MGPYDKNQLECYTPIKVVDYAPEILMKKLAENGPKEAFYLCDLNDIVAKHHNWINLMPRVQPHYAVKVNPSPQVLEILAALGTGFDCASKQEIQQVLSLGVDPERIIFANPAKLHSHINYAFSEGVAQMTFDSESELHKVKSLYPRGAKMVLRIRFDDPEAQYCLGKKFGCDATEDAPHLLVLAKELGIDVIGVSFHIGSSSSNPEIFREAIKSAGAVFEIASNLGIEMNFLDIGGGYLGEKGTSITGVAKVINKALEDFFPDPSVRVISEPGRYYVASAFTLAANIHSMKSSKMVLNRRDSNNNRYEKTSKYYEYYLDVGVYNSFIDVFTAKKFYPSLLNRDRKLEETYSTTIWGPTCDSLDIVCEDVQLPELKIGDWIVFEDLGAYSLSISTEFNGFNAPVIYNIINKKNCTILDAFESRAESRIDSFYLHNLD